MEYSDLKKKKKTELEKLLAEARGTLYDLRIKASVNQLRNVHKLKETKKLIAQISTCIAEQERAEKNS